MPSIKRENTDNIYGYKRLIAWQKADQLVKHIYRITGSFPQSELFGITSQIRRASLSVVLNIVEGYSRNSKNELRRFLSISLGSLAEVGYLLEFSNQQGLITKDTYTDILSLQEECGRIIWKLYQAQVVSK